MSIKLRKKVIAGNQYSYYIDIYPPIKHPDTGKLTRRHFLKLYSYCEIEYKEIKQKTASGNTTIKYVQSVTPKGEVKKVRLTPVQRTLNKEMQLRAEIRHSEIQIAITKGDYSFLKKSKESDCFIKLYEQETENRDKQGVKGRGQWVASLNHLKEYVGGNTVPLSEVDKHFLVGVRDHLLAAMGGKNKKKPLSSNTKWSYYKCVIRMVNILQEKELIPKGIQDGIKKPKAAETDAARLTQDELIKLAATPIDGKHKYKSLKAACLFSAKTSLRYSDIEKLTWGEVEHDEKEGYFITFTQKKTGAVEVLPIDEEARELLGERRGKDEKVFPYLKYGTSQNRQLSKWIKAAGIDKKITFHGFRHTYGSVSLNNGVDIATVSKMLGHSKITTTQIYAKVADEKKRAASKAVRLKRDK